MAKASWSTPINILIRTIGLGTLGRISQRHRLSRQTDQCQSSPAVFTFGASTAQRFIFISPQSQHTLQLHFLSPRPGGVWYNLQHTPRLAYYSSVTAITTGPTKNSPVDCRAFISTITA